MGRAQTFNLCASTVTPLRRVMVGRSARGQILPLGTGPTPTHMDGRGTLAGSKPSPARAITEERALLLRARRARMELETARMRGGTITPEEDERRLEMIRSRLEDIPAGCANGIAEAARRADDINRANAAVGVRLRSAITEALGIVVAITADKTRKAAA